MIANSNGVLRELDREAMWTIVVPGSLGMLCYPHGYAKELARDMVV